jgi:hypothetical protein
VKHCIALIVFSALSLAQGTTAIHINVGGPATGTYVADTVCGGTTYSVAGQTGIYSTEKYGKTFSCDVPASNGTI